MQRPNLKSPFRLTRLSCADTPHDLLHELQHDLPRAIHPPCCGVRTSTAFAHARVRRRSPL